MKKLMFAAVAAAVTGGAFASPLVYDYKANIKTLYLKKIPLKKISSNNHTFSGEVYQKVQKSATLTGYLIQDWAGSLSAAVSGGPVSSADASTAFDMGRSRAFLVVQSSLAEARVRKPKIMPAVIDAKFMDTNFKAKKASIGLAEGVLFVGGETIKAVRPIIDDVVDGTMKQPNLLSREIDDMSLPAANTAGVTAYADYVWTSIYLLGQYNGPNWYKIPNGNDEYQIPFPGFEYAWDQNLPDTLQTGVVDKEHGNRGTDENVYSYYHDTWMNGTGFGKYFIPGDVKTIAGEVCCGLKSTTTVVGFNPVLKTLSGNVKGGIFLCTDNAIAADGVIDGAVVEDYQFFDVDNHRWDEQFVSYRLEIPGIADFESDVWQNDLWQDGAVEQETTDVVTGTWTIKYNDSFLAKYGLAWNAAEIAATAEQDATPDERQLVWVAIKGAAYKLNKNVKFFDGTEIYDRVGDANRFDVPFITPQFIKYYGL